MSTSLTALARTIHLVDIENLAGTGCLTEALVRDCRATYLCAMQVGMDDHVIVGVSHSNNLFAAKYAWPGARVLLRSGPDGADQVLQDVMITEALESRFTNCILATGDGGFAYAVAALSGRGLPVRIVCQTGNLSTKLRLAASTTREIEFSSSAQTRSAG